MKKVLMMSAIAGMALGVQAATTDYRVQINHVDAVTEIGVAGLVPASIAVKLVDISASPASGRTQFVYDSVNFANDARFNDYLVTTENGTYVNLLNYYNHNQGDFSIMSVNNDLIKVMMDGNYGLEVVYKHEFNAGTEHFFGSGKTPEEMSAYAEKNLRTVLTALDVDGEVKDFYLAATYNNDAAQIGTSAELSAIPEPTSGLLALLGLAGLMLKRKRAA